MKRCIRFAVAASATWLASCAQNVGDIDRTQPDRLDVSLLNDGKPWWFLQTVIDVPPQSGVTFIGEASYGASGQGLGINRIVWDVQQNWLIAYNNFEYITDSQLPYSQIENDTVLGNGTPASRTPYFGTPAAAYAITSHFDIERDYNAQTGEQQNVIEENTTDRPWYERQYIRVDWGNNAFGGFNFMYTEAFGQPAGSIVTSPLSYYVDQSDPTNPDHMEITPSYIGIVNKISYTAAIDTTLSMEWGTTVYDCLNQAVFSLGVGDCGPGEVKIRLSFEKVPDTHDFVPRTYTQKDELSFGVWETAEMVYDPQRGYVEPTLEQNEFATMHHIWKADHRTTDPTTGIPCNVNDFSNPNCIAPLNERTPKPIVYYVSPGWPAINDADHYMMWVHEGLISDDYNSDMRGVVAGALRGWDATTNDYMKTSVEYWMENIPDGGILPTNAAGIDYDTSATPVQSYSRYSRAKGLDYLAYPPQLNPSTLGGSDGGEDLSNTAADGTRPAGTWLTTDGSTICTSSQIMVSKQYRAAGAPQSAPCKPCDPTTGFCMGIEHVPYSVVPRMVVFCHNPVEPRQWGKYNGSWTNPETGVTYPNIDKSDSTAEGSFDFSSPGDPDICDTRPDSQRIASPFSPQIGDLRYSMHSYIPEPDMTSPGGIGLPATDPTTGEIISAHPTVYGRAVEGYASTGADVVAVLNGWETYGDLINGNIVDDYLTSLQSNPRTVMSPSALNNLMSGPAGQAKIQSVQQLLGWSPTAAGGMGRTASGGVFTQDYGVANWTALQGAFALNDPTPGTEMPRDFAPQYHAGSNASERRRAVRSRWPASSRPRRSAPSTRATTRCVRPSWRRTCLMDEDIEPTSIGLAKYYKDKFTQHDPCLNTNGITSKASADYRTCIWESARRQILGNIWRSYSDHEVGHTFGMYHNFAGSSDALNYFDPYWDLRVQNTAKTTGCTLTDTACKEMSAALGPTPGGVALAPEWVQAPSYATLQAGMREYQYTSIMEYNARTFNSDFQGLGKTDHATHMYQYGNMVQIFDPAVLTKVPANADSINHAHQIDDQVLQPFNAHYTMYPWIIADGATGSLSKASTTLPKAIQEMVHARKWVRYDDLIQGTSSDTPAGLSDKDVLARDGFASLSSLTQPSTVMVPYRFCSDSWEGGTAWCMAFDQGADVYEQANNFIEDYNFYYYFNNFKRESATFDLNDYQYWNGYWTRLWNLNFGKQAQIAQHWVNDELIVRGNLNCPQDKANGRHYAAMACGQDRIAGVVSIVDFLTKLMQTPSPDALYFDAKSNIVCGSLTCGQDGYDQTQNSSATPPTSPIGKMQHALQPGPSAKADISTFSLNQYGKSFNTQPVTAGIWLDKLLTAQALGDYYTFFIGELNNQPLDYAISMSEFFQNDIVRSMGAMIVNDPRYWPLVAVSTGGASNPATPPITLYRNSNALATVAGQGEYGTATQITPWCPSGRSELRHDPAASSTRFARAGFPADLGGASARLPGADHAHHPAREQHPADLSARHSTETS